MGQLIQKQAGFEQYVNSFIFKSKYCPYGILIRNQKTPLG